MRLRVCRFQADGGNPSLATRPQPLGDSPDSVANRRYAAPINLHHHAVYGAYQPRQRRVNPPRLTGHTDRPLRADEASEATGALLNAMLGAEAIAAGTVGAAQHLAQAALRRAGPQGAREPME